MNLRRTMVWLLTLVMMGANQIHLPVLQGVAWSTMLFNYSRDASFAEAVEKTFNGENPCPLCLAIEKEVAPESSPTWFTFDVSRLTLYLEIELSSFHPRVVYHPHVSHDQQGPEVLYPPELPPPRLCA